MFPPEIIDHVLSFLQWDHPTLRVCAKAHPSLSEPAERYLYAHLTVQNHTSWNSEAYYPAELLNRIIDNPTISKYVRSLEVDLITLGRSYQELESILPAVTQLHSIHLYLDSNARPAVGWNDLSESFRTALTNCLRLPAMANIDVSDIDCFPLSTLDHSSSLKRFSYYLPFASLVYRPLDSLVIYCFSTPIPTWTEIVTTWAESRTFRSLEFTGDLELFSRLLGVSANTLTTLDIHIPHNFLSRYNPASKNSTPFTPIPFTLACPHLAQLTIRSSIILDQLLHRDNSQDSCLPAIMHLLDTLPSPPTNLALLMISVDIDINGLFNVLSNVDWSPLNSFLHFDVIPSVHLRVFAKRWGLPISSARLLDTLKQNPHLMRLERHRSFLIIARV